MSTSEPFSTSPEDRVTALHTAVRRAAQGSTEVKAPVFSPDGGVTVFGAGSASARLQPLGQRTRISLVDGHEMDGEAEVDSDGLVARIAEYGDSYGAVEAALATENGPSH